MKALIKLAILAAIIWAAITYGSPYLEKISKGIAGDAGPADGTSQTCIRAAFDASETFGDVVTSMRVPPDMDRWDAGLAKARSAYDRAERTCECFNVEGFAQPACDEAKKGLQELDRFMRAMDDGFRRGRPVLNAPNFQERVDQHLNRAEQLGRNSP